ncbi:MAG: hypothetical protein KF812_12130 [Fimbriimonadaceae bacterium]|nr:hypothetical protein [Fimbriimonadaceae bacterium]
MPHIRLEMSAGVPALVDVSSLLSRLVECLSGCETVTPSAVKACADIHQFHAIGEGHPAEFVRLTISILEGRPPAVRTVIADSMFSVLRAAIPDSVGISQELRQMNADDYRK